MELPRENVQDYPRPPRLEPVPQRLMVVLGGAVIADTARGLRVLETHHAPTNYIPPEDVAAGALRPAGGGSFCEWKGRAAYSDVTAGASRGRARHGAIRRRAGGLPRWRDVSPSMPR
ncbi:MAG: DUF427 domain-containing protein [Paracoccaceae bacterium]